jgi:uncharacterized cofD-like protein
MKMKIVAIGGGTGLSMLLRGLKQYLSAANCNENGLDYWIDQLTAVVTVTDDGGSSGQLRQELHVLPPGDIRNCMVALAEDEALMTQLFKYRFEGNGHLQGHSFGNLFLTAMTGVVGGDFLEAIRLASEVLAIRGRIYPATVDDVCLAAELNDGRAMIGETNIVNANSQIKRMWLMPSEPQPLPQALAAISEADIITIGPGSLFTSILPNLLVPKIVDAIVASAAEKIFICNVMTQPGETTGFNAQAHIDAILSYAPQLHFNFMLVNNSPLSEEQYRCYAAKGAFPVAINIDQAIESMELVNGGKMKIYYCDLLNDSNPARHNAGKLAAIIKNIAQTKLLPIAA